MTGSPVWISGVGAVSSAGVDVASTLASLGAERRNFSSTPPFKTSIVCPMFPVVQTPPSLAGRYDHSRSLRLAMWASLQALADAGMEKFPPGVRVGVCLGTTVACQLNSLPFYAAWRRDEHPPLDPIYNFLKTNLGQSVADLLGASGPRMTIVNACSSGADAIGVASSWIRAGLCDVAIAGGADELYIVPLAGFWSLGVMSAEPCAPFDRDRSGLNLGEGAGIMILESDAFARRRGKHHAMQIAGYGSACDAHHLTAPHPQGRGLNAAIAAALRQAEIEPSQIAFVNAHGTATQDNDLVEGQTLARIFPSATPMLSTKGYTGHTLGAAGGLEAVFTLLGLREGWIPASAGFVNRSADIPIAPVTQQTRIVGDYALSTSLAFGGNNAAIIIRRVA